MNEESKPRVYTIFSLIFLFALIIIVRLFFVQIVYGEEYTIKADNQYITPASDLFTRGSIFFQELDGTLVSAATIKSGYIVAINPSHIVDADKAYEILSHYITIGREEFLSKAARIDDPYEEIATHVDHAVAVAIIDENIPGITIHRQQWRLYPAGKRAAHILGLLGYQNDTELVGKYGLEQYYDDILSRDDNTLTVNFFAEIFLNITDTILKSNNTRKGDLILTVEPNVQTFLEDTLADVEHKWNTQQVGGVVLDPKDGRVFAMAALPNFDPNNFTGDDVSVLVNPLVESVFEMGSIIKPLTMAAGIDSGAVNAESTYDDKGFVILNGSRIENYDGRGRGIVDMQQVLNQSLNTGAVYVAQKMGHDTFRKYLFGFGINEETGIDLPGEIPGLVSNLESSRDIEYATASFGQGIAMTPIAIARALSALANGGTPITPYLVERIEYAIGGEKHTYVDENPRVISNETSNEITRMLVRVVDEALLNGTVALPHYSIAAKTGTAQIADDENGGYYDDRYLHSFFGYFPAYDPKFLVFLYAVYPKEVRYASQTLTHPFMDISKFLINYYAIPPDR